MKKRFLFALGVIASMAAFTSCGDDDGDEPGGGNGTCSCREYDYETDEYMGSSSFSPEQFGVNNCSQLEDHLNEFTYDTYIDCR